MLTPDQVDAAVDAQLALVTDSALTSRFAALRVKPYAVSRSWDYGAADEQLECWTVLEHRDSNTVIAYCLGGFGPQSPWGLVALVGPHLSMGMDADWFAYLEDALRASPAWAEPNPPGYEVR